MLKNKNNFIIFITFFTLGLVLVFQFRTIVKKNNFNENSYQSIKTIEEELNREKEIKEHLLGEIQVFQDQKIAYINSFENNEEDYALKKLLNEVNDKKMIAGLTNVKGKGISITLQDAVSVDGNNLSDFIIHDSDINQILNELKKAGAQAISINDERIISNSRIICAGPTIIVNQTRCSVPFDIQAIGDPELLYDSLNKAETVVVMKLYGIRVDIKKKEEIEIPAFNVINRDLFLSGIGEVE